MSRTDGRFVAAAALVAATVGTSGEAAAGAFALKERSARAQGLSFAGATAGSGGLQSMGFNPAAIAAVENGEVAGGLSLVAPQIDGEVLFNGTPLQSVDPDSPLGLGNFYAAYRIAPDNLLLGLAITQPFAWRTKYGYDPGFFGQFDAATTDLFTLQFSPVIGYEVLPGLTLAVQGNIFYADARLTTTLLALDGDDTTAGFAVGALWELGEQTIIGVAYDYGYDLELTGTAEQFASPMIAKAELPSTLSVGVVHELTDDIRVMGEAQWQNWSVFDRIDVTVAGLNLPPLLDPPAPDYRDAFFVALGGEYDLTDQLVLRAGAAWDQTPTRDSSRNIRVPDEDRIWLSIGGSYGLTEAITLDAGYSYVFAIEDPTANISNLPIPPGSSLLIEYESAAHIFSIGGSFRF